MTSPRKSTNYALLARAFLLSQLLERWQTRAIWVVSSAGPEYPRRLNLDGPLVSISPYDPSAGFNVGNARQWNKIIYALANAALVLSADLDKAVEPLSFVDTFAKNGSQHFKNAIHRGRLLHPQQASRP